MSNLIDLTKDELIAIGKAINREHRVVEGGLGGYQLHVLADDPPVLVPFNPGYYIKDAILMAAWAGLTLDFSEGTAHCLGFVDHYILTDHGIRTAICNALVTKGSV